MGPQIFLSAQVKGGGGGGGGSDIDYKYFLLQCGRCTSFSCADALRCGSTCHRPHSNSVHLGSEHKEFSLFHTPTGSAHRSVYGLFDFTNRHFDWLTCAQL